LRWPLLLLAFGSWFVKDSSLLLWLGSLAALQVQMCVDEAFCHEASARWAFDLRVCRFRHFGTARGRARVKRAVRVKEVHYEGQWSERKSLTRNKTRCSLFHLVSAKQLNSLGTASRKMARDRDESQQAALYALSSPCTPFKRAHLTKKRSRPVRFLGSPL
jgi:hypothetical protein